MRKSILLASVGTIAFAHPALAQDTDVDTDPPVEAAQSGVVDAAVDDDNAQYDTYQDTSDIVISATRRNEALSDVPLAVSAVTADILQNSGASDLRQLTQVSPSLLVSSTSSEASGGVARIRGVGTVGDNPGLESSVAVFIDGVYRSRTGTGLTELGQVDRIEVLRGPQGTLFGRNASAGLISIITAQPAFEPELSVSATVGNYNMRRGEASITGPLGDTFAARRQLWRPVPWCWPPSAAPGTSLAPTRWISPSPDLVPPPPRGPATRRPRTRVPRRRSRRAIPASVWSSPTFPT